MLSSIKITIGLGLAAVVIGLSYRMHSWKVKPEFAVADRAPLLRLEAENVNTKVLLGDKDKEAAYEKKSKDPVTAFETILDAVNNGSVSSAELLNYLDKLTEFELEIILDSLVDGKLKKISKTIRIGLLNELGRKLGLKSFSRLKKKLQGNTVVDRFDLSCLTSGVVRSNLKLAVESLHGEGNIEVKSHLASAIVKQASEAGYSKESLALVLEAQKYLTAKSMSGSMLSQNWLSKMDRIQQKLFLKQLVSSGLDEDLFSVISSNYVRNTLSIDPKETVRYIADVTAKSLN
jgi:hypothetical protein